MTELLIDTHVHIYPNYNLEKFFDSAFYNFRESKLESNLFALALTERFDCFFFKEHCSRGESRAGRYVLRSSPDSNFITVIGEDQFGLKIIPGRQIVSAEKIEVHSLGSDEIIPDGTPAKEILQRVNTLGATAVLPWSLGKWWGKRGEIVRTLIEDTSLQFLLGDPGHRADLYPTPLLFDVGEDVGRKIIFGSDPLPLEGEEKRVATYLTCCELTATGNSKEILGSLQSTVRSAGERVSIFESLELIWRMT